MVLVKGTTVGTTTDADGRYTLRFPKRQHVVIAVSFLGMESREVAYNNQTELDVQLLDKVESIDDVVVTGYAQVRKESFTGNTTRISREQDRGSGGSLQTRGSTLRVPASLRARSVRRCSRAAVGR